MVEGAEQAAPGEEDPEALYEGAPILEGGDEEEWEQWVDWDFSGVAEGDHHDKDEDVGDGGWED